MWAFDQTPVGAAPAEELLEAATPVVVWCGVVDAEVRVPVGMVVELLNMPVVLDCPSPVL